MFRAIQKKEGFTLVELLIVVAIIGILAAIAIPQMSQYRARAFCSSIQSDLANWAKAQEANFISAAAYTTSAADNDPPGFKPSAGVTIVGALTATGFTGTGSHAQCVDENGAAITYTWDSDNGGLQP
ncbi:MAG: prepilin-type N-terminal cleavage/methylation domain-containing protein [Nitrospinae bacterium]|nr:prepilin-type N-terminal cleavage/methylation domain-containing protein [Nitrospinota bacterium]